MLCLVGRQLNAHCEVPQDSILAPVPYNIYAANFMRILCFTGMCIIMQTMLSAVNCAYKSTVEKLNVNLNAISYWSECNRLTVHQKRQL